MKAFSIQHSVFRMHRIAGLYSVSAAVCVLSAIAVIMTACEKPEEPKPEEPMKLTLSADSVYCVPAYKDKSVLELTWTAASNHGTGSGIAYTIQVDKQGNHFAGGFSIEIGRTSNRSLSLSHKELSDSLRLAFPTIQAETYEVFEWRVRANVLLTGEEQLSNVALLTAKWNEHVITDVYLSWGTEEEQQTEMTMDMQQFSTFTWSGFLQPCDLRLLLSKEDSLPCFVPEKTDMTKLHYCSSAEECENNRWHIVVPGYYRIAVDVKALSISIQGELFIVGDATPYGWDLSQALVMQPDNTNFYRFSWTGQLNDGEFKLVPSRMSFLPCFVADSTDVNKMVLQTDYETYPDNKWKIPYFGEYTIDVDIRQLTITITPLSEPEVRSHVYMIGDATPGGWSWDNITALTHSERNVFEWQGTLNNGQIKFPTELKSDWSGEMLYAPSSDCEPSENGTFEIRVGGDDNKWLIPSAGEWQIRINFNDTTISFVKL